MYERLLGLSLKFKVKGVLTGYTGAVIQRELTIVHQPVGFFDATDIASLDKK